jgi:hypothetical protein
LNIAFSFSVIGLNFSCVSFHFSYITITKAGRKHQSPTLSACLITFSTSLADDITAFDFEASIVSVQYRHGLKLLCW